MSSFNEPHRRGPDLARTPDQEKRAEIAWRAFEYLREQGGSRVTMSALAQALEMKRSTLYWYYSDVASIFEEILSQLLAKQDNEVMAQLVGVEHPIDMLLRYVRSVHGFYKGREDMIVFLFQFWAAGDPQEPNRTLEKLREHYKPRRALAVQMIQAGIDAGQIVPCDANTLVSLVGAIVDGLLVQCVIEEDLDLTPHYALLEQFLEPLRLSRPDQGALDDDVHQQKKQPKPRI